jgi:hypothetical protein
MAETYQFEFADIAWRKTLPKTSNLPRGRAIRMGLRCETEFALLSA